MKFRLGGKQFDYIFIKAAAALTHVEMRNRFLTFIFFLNLDFYPIPVELLVQPYPKEEFLLQAFEEFASQNTAKLYLLIDEPLLMS